MKPLFKPERINQLIGILLILLLLKMGWFVLQRIWLPEHGVDHAEKRTAKPLYYRVRVAPNTVHPVAPRPTQVTDSIKDIRLLAVYRDSKNAVVTVQYKGKTKVLGKGEAIHGYTLDDAGEDYALFLKNGKSYKLLLYIPKKKTGKSSIVPVQRPSDTSVEKKSAPHGEIIDAGDRRIIEKDLLTHYTAHVDEVFRNIGIQDYKKGKKLEGFKVTFVKRGTPFAKLGLKRGDILKAVNGQPLTSYGAAFDTYKQMDDISNITLTVQRGKKEMELEYEID
jgi:general secretion pathway protein C